MRVLSLDSATEVASCAIIEDTRLLGEVVINYKMQHSKTLLPIIDSLLTSLDLTLKDIDGFVVSKGPGSFTGLRIGMATIKGFSQGTKKPFVSVSTLDSLAYNMCYTGGIICPILDALRGNLYTALYTFNGTELVTISDYMVISVEELIPLLLNHKSPVHFIGDGLVKHGALLKESLPDVSFAPVHINLARASALGEIGIKRLSRGEEDNIYDSAPMYLRKPQAEREYEEKMETIKNV
jgi:tRNA threonylcarbamoyladenosine biosynthesis protein TsaB